VRYLVVEKEENLIGRPIQLACRQALVRLSIRKSTFYDWLKRVQTDRVSLAQE